MEQTLIQMPRGRNMRVVVCLSDGHCFWRAYSKAADWCPAVLMLEFAEYCLSHMEDEHVLSVFEGSTSDLKRQDLQTDVDALQIYCGHTACSDGIKRRVVSNGVDVLDDQDMVTCHQERWNPDWGNVRWGNAG